MLVCVDIWCVQACVHTCGGPVPRTVGGFSPTMSVMSADTDARTRRTCRRRCRYRTDPHARTTCATSADTAPTARSGMLPRCLSTDILATFGACRRRTPRAKSNRRVASERALRKLAKNSTRWNGEERHAAEMPALDRTRVRACVRVCVRACVRECTRVCASARDACTRRAVERDSESSSPCIHMQRRCGCRHCTADALPLHSCCTTAACTVTAQPLHAQSLQSRCMYSRRTAATCTAAAQPLQGCRMHSRCTAAADIATATASVLCSESVTRL